MALIFEDCTRCEERHALQSNGRMSIHTTEQGDRCAPPAPVESADVSAPAKKLDPPAHHDVDEELAAAFALAAERKKSSQRELPTRFNRGVYVTSGAHQVRGGLPTLGRGR